MRRTPHLFVYYETIKRELNKRLLHECRCDERWKVKLRYLHVSHTLCCEGDWTPKDKDEVNRREVCECGGWVKRSAHRLYRRYMMTWVTIGGPSTTSIQRLFIGLLGELEHLKIKARLIDEKFASVMGDVGRHLYMTWVMSKATFLKNKCSSLLITLHENCALS